MMNVKILIATLVTIIVHNDICAQGMTSSIPEMFYDGRSYDVFLVKIDAANLGRFDIIENKDRLPHNEFMATLSSGDFFVINASISDSSCNPIGYYVKDSREIQPTNMKNGYGNFYNLKPNGALVITRNDANICESSEIKNYSNVVLGIQSGPMLLNHGVVNKHFNANSKNKHYRCGVGISVKGNTRYLVFCISNEPVTFHNLSMVFKEKYRCTSALCLESAGCAMNNLYLSSTNENFTGMICNYIYFR